MDYEDAIKLIRDDIKDIKKDVQNLIGFKIMLWTGAAVVSCVVSLAFTTLMIVCFGR